MNFNSNSSHPKENPTTHVFSHSFSSLTAVLRLLKIDFVVLKIANIFKLHGVNFSGSNLAIHTYIIISIITGLPSLLGLRSFLIYLHRFCVFLNVKTRQVIKRNT